MLFGCHETGGFDRGDRGGGFLGGACEVQERSYNRRVGAFPQYVADEDDADVGDHRLGGGKLGDACVNVGAIGGLGEIQRLVDDVAILGGGDGCCVPKEDLKFQFVHGELRGVSLGGILDHLIETARLAVVPASFEEEETNEHCEQAEDGGNGRFHARWQAFFSCGSGGDTGLPGGCGVCGTACGSGASGGGGAGFEEGGGCALRGG